MSKLRYALVGTGSRAGMYLDALAGPYRDVARLVGLCDLSRTRMAWHARRLGAKGLRPATYLAADFDRMVRETRPDVVIVATIDREHDPYIVRAMELGCDVISEKPMTTDAARVKAIFAAIERTGRTLRVAFNYRYAPAYTRFRQVIRDGQVGTPLSVDFSWLLDTSHGADYFRRWHREKINSGGLLVHKATHHFDLVNWWIGSYPQQVTALGGLLFYGRAAAEARGERYDYARYTGVEAAKQDPFALDLHAKAAFEGLYLDAEAETGYLRDRNVFGEPVTIEDTMSVSVRYRSGAILSYSLIAYAPWEGLRVAVTGTKGRVEMDVLEGVNHLSADPIRTDTELAKAGAEPARAGADAATDLARAAGDAARAGGDAARAGGDAARAAGDAARAGGAVTAGAPVEASKGAFRQARIRLHHMFGGVEEVPVAKGSGGHGGADPIMLEQLFSPTAPVDPWGRAASHIDGAASVLVGIAANESMTSGRLVEIEELFALSRHEPHRDVEPAVRP